MQRRRISYERPFSPTSLARLGRRTTRALPGFLDHFDHVTFSYELGVVKPQPEIYLDAIQGLGIEPGQALFLDDKAENVEGSIAVGMPALLYTRP